VRNATKDRAKQLKIYGKRVKQWLKENTHCQACAVIAADADVAIRTIRLADECHHMRGRNGDLLLDERYWLPVCMGCHKWITEHGKKARALGLSADVNYR
jgi:hypothetical protein